MGLFSNQMQQEEVENGQSLLEKLGSTQKKAVMVLVSFLVLGLGLYVNAMLHAIKDDGIANALKISLLKVLWYGVTTTTGWIVIVVSLIALTIVYLLISKAGSNLTKVKSTDERNVDYSTDGTYGTAEWMTRDEAETCYEIMPINDANGIILGQYPPEEAKTTSEMQNKFQQIAKPFYNAAGNRGEKEVVQNQAETISLPGARGANNNICILGSPGTGKSFSYVRNAIFQAIKRGESVVVTDPKGELYESSAEILKYYGYKVKVFNLLTPTRSDAWNCTSEIFDPITGDIDETRVADFAEILMKNTTDGPMDEFWGPGEQNLLKAAIFYRAYLHEQSLIAQYAMTADSNLYRNADLTTEDEVYIRNVIEGKDSTMKEREQAFKLLATKVFGDSEAAEEYAKQTRANAEPCTISDIYFELIRNDIPSFERKFSVIPVSHPASIAWGIFKNSSVNTQPGFVTGLAQKMQLFQMRDVRRITTNEDIMLADISAEKTALFVIISDKSTTMRPISSLLFNFLFKDVSDAADKFGAENRLPVNVICDEFANLGQMPQFEVVISTVRSRLINISIILQSVTQLNKVYGEENANTIIACCDTILFLGCNDTETANFISDLSGIATIRNKSIKDSQSTFGYRAGVMQGYSISDGDGKRNLLNPDEVRRLPTEEVLIYHRGHNMLKVNRCGYIHHPYFKLHYANNAPIPLQKVRLKDYQLSAVKYALTEGIDAFLQGDMNNPDAVSSGNTFAQPSRASNDASSLINKLAPQYQNKPSQEEKNDVVLGEDNSMVGKTTQRSSDTKVRAKLPQNKQNSQEEQQKPQRKQNAFGEY